MFPTPKGHRSSVHAEAELMVADVCDRRALEAVLRARKFDSVLHFAAFIEAGESMKEPERFFRNNTANALTLLEAVLDNGIPHDYLCRE